MQRLIALLAALALVALSLQATAAAQGGDSGTDEYLESIPGGGGNKPSGAGGNKPSGAGGGSSNGGTLTPAQAAALGSEGADGAAAAELAEATGPGKRSSDGNGDGADGRNDGAALPDLPGSKTPAVIGDLASDDDSGMGWVLPTVLAVALIVAIALVVRRRRSRGHLGSA